MTKQYKRFNFYLTLPVAKKLRRDARLKGMTMIGYLRMLIELAQ